MAASVLIRRISNLSSNCQFATISKTFQPSHISISYKARIQPLLWCAQCSTSSNATVSNSIHRFTSRLLLRPLVFTGLVSVTAFGSCAIWQYENVRLHIRENNVTSFFKQKKHLYQKLPFREKINRWWNSLSDGRKVASCIIATNIGVFLMWRIPSLRNTMQTWFAANSFSGRSLPLLSSCFSHSEFWHLACNMFVFWSFAPAIQYILGKEQFLAFYLTGGVVASLTSHYFKLLTRSGAFSLGASGALLAVLGAVCYQQPDARLSIIFLPFFTFSAKTALICIIGLDSAGVLLGWKLFDHAAHLGGVLFGIWYAKYGSLVWNKRTHLIKKWHEIREG